MQVGNIGVRLTLDGNDFALSARQATRVVRELRQQLGDLDDQTGKVDRGHSRMFRTLRDGVIVFALLRDAVGGLHDLFLALPTSFIKASGEMERMTMLMRGLSRETTELGKTQEALRDRSFLLDMAKSAPFDIKALTDSFVKLKTAGLDPTSGSARTLVESVAKFGGNSETLKRASVAIQQMSGKGVISMEELRQQLGEAVPTAMDAMSRGMHMTMSELVKAVSTGTVKAEGALKRMFVVMEMQNRGATLAMMDTIPGKMAQMTTSWEIFKASVGDGAFSSSVKRVMDEINRTLNSPAAAEFAASLGTNLADLVDILVKVGHAASEVGPLLASLAAGYALLRTSQAAGNGFNNLMNGSDGSRGLRQAMSDFKTNQSESFKRMIAEREALHRQSFESEKQRIVANLQAQYDAAEKQIAQDRRVNANRKAQMSRDITDFRKKEEDRVAAAMAAEARMIESQREALVRKKAMLEAFQRDFNSQIMFGPNNSIRGVVESGQLQGVSKDEAARIKNQMRELKSEISGVDLAMSALSVNAGEVRRRVADDTIATVQRMATNQKAASAAMDSSISATGARLAWLKVQLAGATASTFAMTNAMHAKAAAASAARMAVQGLGFVINAMGGWVGLAITAIAGLVTWLGTLKSKAEQARDAMDALSIAQQTGKASKEDVGKLETNRDNVEGSLRTAENNIRRMQQQKSLLNTQTGMSVAARKAREKQLDDDIAAEQKQITGLRSQLSAADQQLALVKTLNQRTIEAAGAKGRMVLNADQIRKNVAPYQKQVESANAEFEKARAAGASKEQLAKLNEKALNAELQYQLRLNAQYVAIDKALDARKKSMSKGGYDEMKGEIQGKLKETNDRIANVRQSQLAPGPDAFTNGGGKGGAGKPIPPSFFEMDKNMLIKQNIERVASLNLLEESMSDMVTYEDAVKQYRAAYMKMAEEGIFDMTFKRKGKDGKEETYTQRPGAGDLNEAADEAALKYKLDATKKIMSQIKQASDDMQSTYDSLRNSEGDDSIQGPIRKFDKMRNALMQLKGLMNKDVFDAVSAKLGQGQTAAIGVTVENFVKLAEDKANEASEAMMTASQRQDAQLKRLKDEWLKTLNDIKSASGATEGDIAEVQAAYDSLIKTVNQQIDLTPIDELGRKWADTTKNLQDMGVNWTSGFADAMTELVTTGKADFGSLASSIMKDITQMIMRMLVFKSLAAMGVPGFGGGPTVASANGNVFNGGKLHKFAKGGVFTNSIATRPTMAPMSLFGEDGPEAIMPLGRSGTGELGVKVIGSAGASSMSPQQSGMSLNVDVNMINESGNQLSAEKGEMRFDFDRAVIDVVLKSASQPGKFRDGLKSAMA